MVKHTLILVLFIFIALTNSFGATKTWVGGNINGTNANNRSRTSDPLVGDAQIFNGITPNITCNSGTDTITETGDCSVGAASSTPTLSIHSTLTNITHTTSGVTGISSSIGLPAGVRAAYANNTIILSGTPTVSGTFNYTINPTACSTTATGTITVIEVNKEVVGSGTAKRTMAACATAWNSSTFYGPPIGCGTPYGGSTVSYNGNNYTVTMCTKNEIPSNATWAFTPQGACTSCATVLAGSIGTAQTICYNTTPSILTNISSASGGDGSFTYQWQSATDNINFSNISGATATTYAPSALTANKYFRRVATSGSSCGSATTSSIYINVNSTHTVGAASLSPSLLINTQMSNITHSTNGVTGIISSSGLPAGVTATYAFNMITISGTPTVSGTYNYTITPSGCGSATATGTITVNESSTAGGACSDYTTWYQATWNAGQLVRLSGTNNLYTPTYSSTPAILTDPTTRCEYSVGCFSPWKLAGTCIASCSGDASSSPNVCINTAMTAITHTTSGVSGITSSSGLPAGVTATYANNKITISGTPSQIGIFNYSISPTGCSVTATGTIKVISPPTINAASSSPSLCINTTITSITHATTGVTGIISSTGLPVGVSATYVNSTITISGKPTESGIFNYTITPTSTCGSAATATGTITVTDNRTVGVASSTPTLLINTQMSNVTHSTNGVTGIISSSGLPAGVTATYASNTILLSGTPSQSGTFNYTIIPSGCGSATATGTLKVRSYRNTWNGTASNLWNNPTNWDLNKVPSTGDTLVFPAGVANTSTINDIPAGTSFSSIIVGVGAFKLTGNALSLSGEIVASATDTVSIGNDITFSTTGKPHNITCNLAGKLVLSGKINNGGDTLLVNSIGSTLLTGIISGAGALTKTGAGALTLSGNNTFTGGVNLNQGTINLGNTNCLGTVAGTLTIAAGTTLRNTLGTFLTLANYPMKWLGNFSFDAGLNTSIGSGNIQLMGDVTISITNGLYLYNIISGNFSLTKAGLGQMQFMNSSNTYTGKSACIAGTTFVRILPNLGGISNFGQPSTINNGTISLGAGSNSVKMHFISSNMVTDRVIDMAGTTGDISIISNGSTSSINFSSNFTATGNGNKTIEFIAESKNNTVSGSIPNPVSGIISLNKSGLGKWTLSGNNTYTGITSITQGVLQIGNGGTSGSLASTAILNLDTLIIDRTNTMTYVGIIYGTGKLIKKSAGTLTLSGVNTYTGGTTITEGTIELGITNALSATSIVLNGGILSTGSSVGFSNTTSGSLTLSDSATIALGTGNHTLAFAASNGTTWTAEAVLKITGWNGNFDGTNTGATAHLLTGSSAELTSSKLAQIQFYRTSNAQLYTATQLTSGEIVPTATLVSVTNKTAIWDGGSAVNDNWTTAANWVGDIAPIAGDTLVFDGKVRLNPNNDFPTNTAFVSIGFSATADTFKLNGNPIKLTGGLTAITSSSNKTTIFNHDITFTNPSKIATSSSGRLGFNSNIDNGGYDITFDINGGTINFWGIISGKGGIIKNGNNVLLLDGQNNYLGTTTITKGTIKLTSAEVIPNVSKVNFNGGGLITTAGNTEYLGELILSDSSLISLEQDYQSLVFASSNGEIWNAGDTLTIHGWKGGYDGTAASNSDPKLFIGASADLSPTKVAQIKFYKTGLFYTATQLANGEIVPAPLATPTITITGNTNALSTNHGTASATKTYSVAGSNLTDNLIIVAPKGYEIGLSELGAYGSTISFPPNNYEVLSTNFYLRISASTTVGSINASNIRGTSTGADTVYYAIPSGTVLSTILEQAKDTLACNGSLSTFIVKAVSGSSFQWQVNEGTGFVSISNSALYKGTDNDTLTIKTVGIGMNKFQYRCLVNIDTSNIVTLNVKLYTTPTAIISGSDTICTGLTSSKIKIDLTGTSPWTIEYSKGAGSFPISNITTNPYYMSGIVYPTSINYSLVSVKDASNCLSTSSVSGNAFVKTVAKPAATIGVDTTICTGAEAKLHFNFTGSANFKVKYHDGLQYDSTYATSNSKTIAVSPTKTTTYNLVSVSTGNCTNTTTGKSATITVNTPPTASMTVLGSDVICNGASASLQLSITGPASTWTIEYSENGNKKTTPAFSTQNYTLLVNPSSDANYQLTAIRDLNCSAAIAPVSPINITVKSSGGRTSNPMIDQAGVYTCNTNTLQLVVSNQETGAIYQWYRNGRLIIGANNDTLPVLTYGKYTLNEAYCRPSLSAYTIDSTVFGTAPVITTNNIGTKEGYLQTTAPINASVQWYINDYKLEGETQEKLKISFNGTYKVSVTKANCTSFSLPIQILDQNYLDARLALVYHADSSVSFNDIHNSPYTVVPNTSKDEIHVLGPDMSQNYDIHIRDITGKLVYQSSNNLSKNTIHDIADLPTDIYIVELRIENQSYFVKFVKN